ncbi:MAG: DUF962 domain-containing protein [Flavobacteriaceae bacterium]
MKSQQQWFDEYAVSHQNEQNQKIHYICVPLIFWSIVALLVSIPNTLLVDLSGYSNPYIMNWGSFALLLAMTFYLRAMEARTNMVMLLFSLACIFSSVWLKEYIPLWQTALAVFVLAWIGQFYGHKIEGVKPSFLKDLQFLLIGPAWVFYKMTR